LRSILTHPDIDACVQTERSLSGRIEDATRMRGLVNKDDSSSRGEHLIRCIYVGFGATTNLEAAGKALVVLGCNSSAEGEVGRAAGDQIKGLSWVGNAEFTEVGASHLDGRARWELFEGRLCEKKALRLSFNTEGKPRSETMRREKED
jgi:hypothetical protein